MRTVQTFHRMAIIINCIITIPISEESKNKRHYLKLSIQTWLAVCALSISLCFHFEGILLPKQPVLKQTQVYQSLTMSYIKSDIKDTIFTCVVVLCCLLHTC